MQGGQGRSIKTNGHDLSWTVTNRRTALTGGGKPRQVVTLFGLVCPGKDVLIRDICTVDLTLLHTIIVYETC